VFLVCGHGFCASCLDDWQRRIHFNSRNCPKCNKEISFKIRCPAVEYAVEHIRDYNQKMFLRIKEVEAVADEAIHQAREEAEKAKQEIERIQSRSMRDSWLFKYTQKRHGELDEELKKTKKKLRKIRKILNVKSEDDSTFNGDDDNGDDDEDDDDDNDEDDDEDDDDDDNDDDNNDDDNNDDNGLVGLTQLTQLPLTQMSDP
jgi:Zinc finger, C3HC4 type (RING finger)